MSFDKKISALNSLVTPLVGNVLAIVDGTETKKITVGNLIYTWVDNVNANSKNITGLGTINTHTLPGGTGTIAILDATQTFLNKTLSSTDNTIISASQAVGDLLKNNGTKYVRFARGSALQQIRVNAGGTDLEYFTPVAAQSKSLLAADATEEQQTGTTPLLVKDASFIKNTAQGIDVQTLHVVAEIKTTAGTGHCRVRLNGSGSDSLDLTTTSVTYAIVAGSINVSALGQTSHTIEIFIDTSSAQTIVLRNIQIYQA